MTDNRREVIAKIHRIALVDLLAGRVECVNFPDDGVITAMVCDIASDSLMIRIQSSRFPVVPQFERFPDFDLKLSVLVSAASES